MNLFATMRRSAVAAQSDPSAVILDKPAEPQLRLASGGPTPATPSKWRIPRYWHNSKLVIEVCRPVDMLVAFSALVGAFLLTNMQYMPQGMEEFLLVRGTPRNIAMLGAVVILWPIIFSAFGLYNGAQIKTPRDEAIRIFGASLLISATTLLFQATSGGTFGLQTVGIFWVFSLAGTLAMRHLTRFALGVSRARAPRQVLIVGSGPRAFRLYEQVTGDPHANCEIVGFVDTSNRTFHKIIDQLTLGTLDELEGILMHRVVDSVFIALPIRSCYQQIQDAIRVCERVGVESRYLADVFECTIARPSYQDSTNVPAIALKVVTDDLRLLIKRTIDIVGALVGLAVLSPVLLAVAAAVKMTSPGPIFFVQKRYGYNKRIFSMYKFRTMVVNAEALMISIEHLNEAKGPIFKIKHDPRLTPVGKFLRRTSLDELPQLLNVLKGEMSLVGPRPMSTRDVQLFPEAWLMRRFSVTPGLTGLWQVSGRSNLAFDDWVALDLRYIDEWSLTLDLRILVNTLPVVLKGTGAE
jgi:exopolysaccharide biosynthesis polyprenyl glycosylphosphotransferase